MSKWLVRGLAFAAFMLVVLIAQAALINQFPTHALLISIVLLVVFGVAALLWGLADGRSDARQNPDPDRREDLAMTWLVAGLVAGLVSGVLSWLISLAYQQLYTSGLIGQVTTFAAFTALLVFLPAILAVAIGRWLVDRKAPEVVRHGHAHDDIYGDTAGNTEGHTDVFDAVQPAHKAQ